MSHITIEFSSCLWAFNPIFISLTLSSLAYVLVCQFFYPAVQDQVCWGSPGSASLSVKRYYIIFNIAYYWGYQQHQTNCFRLHQYPALPILLQVRELEYCLFLLLPKDR